jgi:tRNA threonylcarbamoyladenosine modification (KEOPS) complex  Pcc1 subunit
MKVTIDVRTPTNIEIVKKALQTEIESSPYKKTEISLNCEKNQLTILIETTDIRALRGTFNSLMNWLITILESLSLE